QQTIYDKYYENCARKERKISKEAGEVFVACHIADAEDKNAKADQRDHDQHGGSKWIKHPAEAKCLVAEGKPGEILNSAETRSLQCRQKRQDRESERNDLTDDCSSGRGGSA